MTPSLKSLMLSVLVVAGANSAFARPEVLKDAILRIDDRLDRLLGKDADVAIVHSGVGFFEGPRWIEQGASSYLAFTDLAGNAIRRLNADGTASTIIGDIFVDADASEAPIFKVGSRYVQGRTAAGGWSQQRFARRRAGQVHGLVGTATEVAVRVLLPGIGDDALITGGDRALIDRVLADPRLQPLGRLYRGLHLEIGDPKFDLVKELPERGRAIRIALEER